VDEGSGNGSSQPRDLTALVASARSGLRRDVSRLVDAIDHGELLVPLARSVAGIPIGEEVELEHELSLVPHLLADEDSKLYCVLFTRDDLLEPIEEQLGWTTDDSSLEYCALPARVALQMALDVIDGEQVLGLVLNPQDESELFLRREELASLVSGRPIPLVGYVNEIPEDERDKTLTAEPAEPPPPELIETLERGLKQMPEVASWELRRTFNPDRDLEPHFTLTLRVAITGVDRNQLTSEVIRLLEGKLPPPGYIDILFEDAVVGS